MVLINVDDLPSLEKTTVEHRLHFGVMVQKLATAKK